MEIHISSAIGHGLTELSAFDGALSKLGVRDQNLIHLSSVIPLNAEIIHGKVDFNNKFLGDRLYCVYAERRTATRGTTVAAGLGWATTLENPNWGIFVEHTGNTEEEVDLLIKSSLESMIQYRSDHKWSEFQSVTTSAMCENKPVCALALAVYNRIEW